jgi:hypothetical protein
MNKRLTRLKKLTSLFQMKKFGLITRTPKAGKKYFYRCNQTLKRGKQCVAAILIFQPAESLNHEVHRTNCKIIFKLEICILEIL